MATASRRRSGAAIYRRHEEAQAVVHTHSDHCVALASNVMALPGFHYLVGQAQPVRSGYLMALGRHDGVVRR